MACCRSWRAEVVRSSARDPFFNCSLVHMVYASAHASTAVVDSGSHQTSNQPDMACERLFCRDGHEAVKTV
jgi:hypothetical protein